MMIYNRIHIGLEKYSKVDLLQKFAAKNNPQKMQIPGQKRDLKTNKKVEVKKRKSY